MKKSKCLKKKLIAMIMMVIMTATVLSSSTVTAEAATAMGNISIICYLRGNSRVNTYQSVNGAYSGYIDVNDQCTILAVYDNGWVKVSYPVGNNKTKTAYTHSSNFFVNTNFSTSKVNAGSNYTVYKKSNLASKLGSLYSSDNVILIGTENGKQQLVYPISGSDQYKMGFINGTISNKTTANTVSASTIEALCFDYIYYADKYTDLKAAYSYNKDLLYSHWKKYGIKEGRSASPVLDLKYYLDKNPDLYNAFGTDYTRIYNHFITYGYKEFRASSPYYNGQQYRNSYADLRNFDSAFLINHYYHYGIAEKRQAGEKLFTGNYTKNSNSNTSTNTTNQSNGDTVGYPMTNAYVCGNDWKTYYAGRPSRPYHVGIDIASRTGDSNVYAAADGTVAKTGYNSANGYYVIIKHTISSKTVYSFYAHLQKGSISVSQGQSVSKGTKIGVFGNTGSGSHGAHLHFAFTDTLSNSGGYWGYVPNFSGNKTVYQGTTYYNPHYVVEHNKLP